MRAHRFIWTQSAFEACLPVPILVAASGGLAWVSGNAGQILYTVHRQWTGEIVPSKSKADGTDSISNSLCMGSCVIPVFCFLMLLEGKLALAGGLSQNLVHTKFWLLECPRPSKAFPMRSIRHDTPAHLVRTHLIRTARDQLPAAHYSLCHRPPCTDLGC